jgi:hypothetical protein
MEGINVEPATLPSRLQNWALACSAALIETFLLVLVTAAAATAAALRKGTAQVPRITRWRSVFRSASHLFRSWACLVRLAACTSIRHDPWRGVATAGKFPWRSMRPIQGALLAGVAGRSHRMGRYRLMRMFDSHLGAPASVNGAEEHTGAAGRSDPVDLLRVAERGRTAI